MNGSSQAPSGGYVSELACVWHAAHMIGFAHNLQSLTLIGCRLVIVSAGMQAPLPDIQPGTLLQLQRLHIYTNMLSTLPASWGSRQDVLPNLEELYIHMHISGPLPAAWSAGFQKLTTLTIRQPGLRSQSRWAVSGKGRWGQVCDSQSQTASAEAVPELTDASGVAAYASQRHLPPEWSTGFPVVSVIVLEDVQISGTFPSSWSTTGFPALARLSLQNNQLSGPLPSQLLASHNLLVSINVSAVMSGFRSVFAVDGVL